MQDSRSINCFCVTFLLTSPIVAKFASNYRHKRGLGTWPQEAILLQKWENTRPYEQPFQPIALDGERHALPCDLVDGLTFLLPFLKRKGNPVEIWVHLINTKLFVITNSLILDYEIANSSLPDLKFNANAIRTLGAFDTAPSNLMIQDDAFLWEWPNGEQLFVSSSGMMKPICFGDHKPTSDARASSINAYWGFNNGEAVSEETRKRLRRWLSASKLHRDVYVASGCVISRMKNLKGSNEDTLVGIDDFENNATRTMRFDRHAFVSMIKVATEIDFDSSPICFLHDNGRGLLVEKTLGSDVPDYEVSDG